MLILRKATLCATALLCCLGGAGVLSSGQAQTSRPPSGLTTQKKPVASAPDILEQVVNVPGRGPVKLRFRRLPPSAIHRVNRQTRGSAFSRIARVTTPSILWSSETDYTGDGVEDALWIFPTIGYDTANAGPAYAVPNTIESNAPASPNNLADISYGEMGRPGLVSRILVDGSTADVSGTTYNPAAGRILIVLFDGIDANTPPVFGQNSAHLQNTSSGTVDGYYADFGQNGGPAAQFATWELDTIDSSNNNDPYVITDSRGRFGFMVAKTSDGTSTNVQWAGLVNSPHGPNQVWQVANGQFTVSQTSTTPSATLAFFPSDPNFNQGADQFGAYNYFYELDGTNSDGSAAQGGTLQGNIRRRGVNPPHAPGSTTILPEAGPGFYKIIATDSNSNLIRQDYLFTQPSYDSTGKLTINYKLEGYPTGTYNITIQQMPVVDANDNTDIVWPNPTDSATPLYPYGDFIPAVQTGVTISNGNTTTFSARMERLGDISDENGDPVPDGVVDFNDLNRLILSFNQGVGDPFYDPGADIVGDPTINPNGTPDGFVDFNDLDALILEYNLGNFEDYSIPGP